MYYKYDTKRPFLVLYFILIFIGILLTLGRWYSVFNPNFVIINREVHSHVSNLSLSMVVYIGIGYSWLLYGIKFRFIQVLGICLVISNLVCETIMEFMNTADIVDAIYGIVGVLISYTYLIITNKYGLKERLPNKG